MGHNIKQTIALNENTMHVGNMVLVFILFP